MSLREEIKSHIKANCVREPKRREQLAPVSLNRLPSEIPEMLTWPEKPEAAAGDIFVFEYGRYHYIDPATGKRATSEFPAKYLKLTAHPVRHRKGHWQAPFTLVGWDTTEFMSRGYGTTSDRRRAIDDAPLEDVSKSTEQARREAAARRLKIQRVGKKERLKRAA